jgi:hypothetical protein
MMLRLLRTSLLVLPLVFAACATHSRAAAVPVAPAQLPPGSSLAVIELEQQLDQALSQGDAFALEPLLGEDYRGISWKGERRTKAQTLEHLRSQASAAQMKIAVDPDEFDTKLFADFAIVMGRGNYERPGGGGGYQAVRFTHVWSWSHERWTLVASHESPVTR